MYSVPLFVFTSCSFTHLAAIRDVDERLTKFLYADDPSAAGVVSEYQLHKAPSGDYEEEGEDYLYDHKPGEISDYEATRHVRPYFLEKKTSNPRVVVFYSPWSGGSQDFKPGFIELAKEMKRRQNPAQREGSPIQFYAISCSAHIWVCQDDGIKTFPTVKAYRAGETSGTILKWFTADAAAMALAINLEDDNGQEKGVTSAAVDYDEEYKAPPKLDILGASFDGHKRTKNDLYNDAALSFTHALRLDIFPTEDARLNDEAKSAFVEWIDLLYWTLPPTWRLHTLIQDIRTNIDTAMESRAELVRFVETHSDVVLEGRTHWTDSCNHGRPGEGYACGMWALFHILSVGVSERHDAVLGGRDRVSTAHAARTVRDYVEHFFKFVCGRSCQRDFVQMFDSCGFKHCKKFRQNKDKKSPPTEASWREFALWMFEVHNHITTKLLRDEALSHGRKASTEEEETVLWPSPKACRLCRWENGKWNYDSVFSYLRTEYWPGGVHNFRFVVLDKKNKYEAYGTVSRWAIPKTAVFFVGIALAAWMMKKQHLLRTGRHKKFEGDFV